VSFVGEETAHRCRWHIRRLQKKIALTGTYGAVATVIVDMPIRLGKQTLGLQLFVSPHITDSVVLGQDVVSRMAVREGRLLLTLNDGEIIDTLADNPFRLLFEAIYLDEDDDWGIGELEPAEEVPETEVHSMEEASEIVKSHTLESGAAPSITEDFVFIREEEDLQENEGVVPRMWSTVTNALSAQSDEDREGATGPYIPSFSVNERSDSAAKVAGATGEARFGDAESIDEWRDPFPVLGVAAELADESTTPAPVFQLERNQLDLSRDSSDWKMIPAGAELMETAELKETCPLVDGALDTAEDYLHQTTGNIQAELPEVLELKL